MSRALPSRRQAASDALIALLLFALGLWEILARPVADDVVQGPLALNLAALSLATLPLAARRRAPLAVTLVVFGALAARALAADPLEIYPPLLAGLIASYTVAAYSSLAAALGGLAAGVGSVELAAALGSGGDAAPDPMAAPVLLGAVWAVGRVAGSRFASARTIERQAAERDRRREEHVRLAAEAERRRIARELHDSVSHSLALIAMQAGGAQEVLRSQPDRAEASLGSIERAAREGLTEMRRMLGLMDSDSGGAALSPGPGLARVHELVDGARRAGLEVALVTEGEPGHLPVAVDAAAYRILQEALTNAAKHAGRCRAYVILRWLPSAVEVEVVNDGAQPRPARDGGGRGLIGMRERATLVDGELEAGGLDGGSFRVWARLPFECTP